MDQRQALIAANQYLDLLKETYPVKKAFLFGSFAKGNYHVDSDIDVAVIVDQADDIFQMQVDMMRFTRQVDINIEPHPFLEGDFNINSPLAYEIMKYGIEIGNFETVAAH